MTKYLFEWLDESQESGRAYVILESKTLTKCVKIFTEIHPEVKHYQVYQLGNPVICWMDTAVK